MIQLAITLFTLYCCKDNLFGSELGMVILVDGKISRRAEGKTKLDGPPLTK